jgi:hypothetical protein
MAMPKPEEILALPSGAIWLKADLHVHTPASLDIASEWEKASPQDIVRIAIEKHLDVIAITDHNTADWCDRVREAACDTSLTVFPGVEISTHQGHILGVFDVNTPASLIADLLLKLEIPRERHGSLEVATSKGVVETCSAIEHDGGVAIAAHIDGERGFWKMIKAGDERKRAYAAPCLRALEIVNPSLRDDYQKGATSGYPRRLACIQGSDCWDKDKNRHNLDSMACKFSLLKIDEKSLAGLKLALVDPEMRVRLPHDDWPSPNQAIEGFWVTGGFLDGQVFRLNDNVNCFIGDTGTGKSVALELIRFGLNQVPRVSKIQKEVTSLLDQQLGNLGTIHILLRKGDKHYLVERTWCTPPAMAVVYRLDKTGIELIEGELDTRLLFPLKAFSQSEIIEFAREPEVRLSLTDDLIDLTIENTKIKDLKVKLRENATSIDTERNKESNIRSHLADLPTLLEGIARIDEVLKDPDIMEHQRWYEEQATINQVQRQFNALPTKVKDFISLVQLAHSPLEDLGKLPNTDLMQELKAIYDEWQTQIVTLEKAMTMNLDKLLKKLEDLRGRWNERFIKAEEKYRQLLATLDKDGLGFQTLSENRQRLELRISELGEHQHELDTHIVPRIQELEKEREEYLTGLQDSWKSITAKREAKAKELSEKLEYRIRLNVDPRANRVVYRTELQKIAQGSFLQAHDLDLLAKCHPVPLVKYLLTQDLKKLSKETQIEETKLSKLWDTILERKRLADLYELQLTDVEDIIEVMLKVGKDEYKALKDLAHGQKCMVVLMVALAEGDFPLIVDQPEDALHAPSIEEGIVSTLRSRRGIRQYIFATRNANILVSADAEQILALEADAHHGELKSTGSLDKFDHRNLVIYHVEGGKEAFERRLTIYFLRPTP